MTAPDKIWLDPECVKDTDWWCDQCWHSQEPDNCEDCGTPPTEYTRTPIAQAAVAAAYEAAAEMCFAPEAAHIAWDMGQGNFPKQSARHEFIAAMIRALATPDQIAALAAERAKLDKAVEALRWYAEQARLCRLIHGEGDAGRSALAADGGAKANAALAEIGGA